MASKNIQIPRELFYALCGYFLDGSDVDIDYIRASLTMKRRADENRILYSMSKSELLDAESREECRQEYLNRVGVPSSFRWNKEEGD